MSIEASVALHAVFDKCNRGPGEGDLTAARYLYYRKPEVYLSLARANGQLLRVRGKGRALSQEAPVPLVMPKAPRGIGSQAKNMHAYWVWQGGG